MLKGCTRREFDYEIVGTSFLAWFEADPIAQRQREWHVPWEFFMNNAVHCGSESFDFNDEGQIVFTQVFLNSPPPILNRRAMSSRRFNETVLRHNLKEGLSAAVAFSPIKTPV